MKNITRRWLRQLLQWGLQLRSQPMPLSSAVTLIIAPHQDDETLGCGGLIVLKRMQAHPVQVAFLTDGAASHPHRSATVLAGQRREEAGCALSSLGLAPDQVHFFAAPDGRLPHLDPAAAEDLVARLTGLIVRLQPDEVFLPYRHDGSTEHTAAFALARQALARSGSSARVFEYPIWAWWSPRLLLRPLCTAPGVFRLRLAGAEVRKQEALGCYRTQIEALAPAREPVLPADFVALFSRDEEYFFQG